MALITPTTQGELLIQAAVTQIAVELRAELKAQFQAMADEIVLDATDKALRKVQHQVDALRDTPNNEWLIYLRALCTIKVE